MSLLAFPRGATTAKLAGGESITSTETGGKKRGKGKKKGPKKRAAAAKQRTKRSIARRWTLEIDGSRRRSYELQASMSTLESPFKPCRVKLNGKRLLREGAKKPKSKRKRRKLAKGSWSYDPATQVLRATFSSEDARLRAWSGCGKRRR